MSKFGYVKNLGNGKYFLRLSLGFDDFGKRIQPSRTIEAKSDRDAEKKLMEFYNDRVKTLTEKRSSNPETLDELYKDWLKNHVEANLRDDTKSYYTGLWENYLKEYGKAKIKTFSPKMVNSVLSKLEKGSRTRKGVYGMLKAMFNKAKKWGYITTNPCDNVDTPKYRAKEKKPYTDEELLYILNIIASEKLCYQAIFYFAVICGMRRGEIIGLKWTDINFDRTCFDIQRSVTNKKGIGTVPGETKNFTSMRQLELPQVLIQILKGIRAEQTAQKLRIGDKWVDEGWVFTRWNGMIMGESCPDRWLARMKKQYPEWPKKDLHTLRHTAITNMIIDGIPISEVSKAAGHAQQYTTLNTYSHIIQSTKKRAINSQEDHIEKLKNKSVQQSVQFSKEIK